MDKKMKIVLYIIGLVVILSIGVYAFLASRGTDGLTGNVVWTAPLHITVGGSGTGSVTSGWISGGINLNCQDDCTIDVVNNEYQTGQANLYAIHGPGSRFQRWTGSCSGTEPYCQVYVWRAEEVGAQFESSNLPQMYKLSVSTSRHIDGLIVSNISGINCGTDCSEYYPEGTLVELTATANPGYSFYAWHGHVPCLNGQFEPTCIVSMNFTEYYTAVFNELPAAPMVPSNLVLTPEYDTTLNHVNVKLSFAANADADGFIIKRADAVGRNAGPLQFQTIATIGNLGNTARYTDNYVTDGKSYVYNVVAYNEIGDSAPAAGTVNVRCKLSRKLTWIC